MAEVLTATPATKPDGSIEWTLCYHKNTAECGIGTPTSPYPTIDVAKGSGSHDIIFIINDTQNIGVKFDPTTANAFWVTPGKGQHLGSASHDSANQLGTVTIPNPSVLIVPDKNDNKGPQPLWLSYRLNFVDSNNQPVTPIDPDIKNGGGSNFVNYFLQPEIVGYTLIAALVVFLVGVWIGRVTKKARAKV